MGYAKSHATTIRRPMLPFARLVICLENKVISVLKISILTLVFCLFCAAELQAQTQDRLEDLLKKLEKADEDTAKVNLLNELAFEYAAYSQEEALKYTDQAIKLAKKLKYQQGLANTYHITGNIYFYVGNYEEAYNSYIKSIEIKEKIGDKAGMSKTYNNVANLFRNTGNLDKALEYTEKALALNIQIGNKQGVADSYFSMGNLSEVQGDYEKALEYLEKSKALFKDIGDKNGEASCLNSIGIIYTNQAAYDLALENYFESLRIQESLGDKNAIAYCYNNIGIISLKKENYDQALEYYQKALDIKLESGNKNEIALAYNNIGNVYYSKGVKNDKLQPESRDSTDYFAKALEYITQSLELSQEIGNKKLLASCYYNIGDINRRQGNYSQAVDYFHKSATLVSELGDKSGIAYSELGIGSCYNELKQYSTAEKHLLTAFQIGEQTGSLEIKRLAADQLALAYSQTGNYKKAFEYLSLVRIITETINNEETTKRITQLSMQYEFEKKEQQAQYEQQQKELEAQARLNRQKLMTVFFIIGFGLMLVLAVVIYRSYRQKREDNILLERQKNEILEKNQILEQQKSEIEMQRDRIAKQKEAIMDSIHYAQRIQSAILPPREHFEQFLPEHFILFRPRDIVSGDFYWIGTAKGKVVVTAADCTGHGVPGAFMSMLGMSFLDEIVLQNNIVQANEILNQMRNNVKKSLRQTGKEGEAKDGMDMSLCVIDFNTMTLQFAAAYNPMIVIRKESEGPIAAGDEEKKLNANGYELAQIKADRMPIAIFLREKNSFTLSEFPIKKGDAIYMFSDGYIDQFGGERADKFMIKKLKDILLQIQDLSMCEQKAKLEEALDAWKKGYDQVDDILVMGIKI